MSEIGFHEFSSRSAASAAAAAMLADSIDRQWQSRKRASIVVSGGSTPGECFDILSQKSLPWSGVTVVPSDERWVPASHQDSNERLLRARLLQNHANTAQVLPLFREGTTAEAAANTIETDLQSTALPFACVMLGMGEDGHFASLFPDFEGLDNALNPTNPALIVPVKTHASPYQRLSLTLSALLQTQHIVLLFFGQAKRAVFHAAKKGETSYPVHSLLINNSKPLTVIWAD